MGVEAIIRIKAAIYEEFRIKTWKNTQKMKLQEGLLLVEACGKLSASLLSMEFIKKL